MNTNPTMSIPTPNGKAIQVPVDMRNARQQTCECGCKTFVQEIYVYTVSAVVSPIGKELTIQRPCLVCMDCRKLYDPTSGKDGNGTGA